MTQVAFCIICLTALLFSYLADKKNKISILIFVITILSLAAGLRVESVGLDTRAYVYNFNNDFPLSWQFDDEGFRYISRFLMKTFNNSSWLLFIYSLITNLLIVFRLWDFRHKSSFSFMMFLYLTINYINTMNIMRQYVIVAIIFFATRYLEKKHYAIFTIAVLISSTIHSTALLGLAFLIVYLWKNVTLKHRKWLIVPIFLFIPIVVVVIFRLQSDNITNYLSQKNTDINITYLYRICIFFVIMLLQKIRIKISLNTSLRHEALIKPISWRDNETIFYLAGLGASSLGMFFAFLSRLGICYLMYELVFWGRAVKDGKGRSTAFILSTIFAIYTFALELILNGSGIFPYAIQWF